MTTTEGVAATTAPATEVPLQPQETDVDALELQAAIEEAKAEEAAKAAAEGNGAEQPKPADNQPKPQGEQPEAPMIPKARLDEVLARTSKAEQEAAYWRGVAEARGQQQPAPGKPQAQQPQQPTLEQRCTEIATQQEALAKKFDDGEITMVEFKKQERELSLQEVALREEALLAKVNPAQPAASADNELYLETLTAQLEEAHPWVGVFEKVGTDSEWRFMRDRAIENLVGRGVDPTKGMIGKYELRKEIANIADQVGPFLLAERAQAKGVSVPTGQQSQPQGQPQQQQQPSLSKQAQQRLDKLSQAANAPPNLSAMSGASGDVGMPTESAIDAMSDEEIGNLPISVRRKLLGVT